MAIANQMTHVDKNLKLDAINFFFYFAKLRSRNDFMQNPRGIFH